MNLKKRLLLTNLSLLAIPPVVTVFLFTLALYFATAFSGTSIQYEHFEKAVQIRTELFRTAALIWRQEPETLARDEFGQYLTVQLADLSAEVLVTKSNEPVFLTRGLDLADIEAAGDLDILVPLTQIRIGETSYAQQTHSFTFQDGSPGRIFLLIPSEQPTEIASFLLFFLLAILFLSGLATNIFYSLKIYRNLASPLVRVNQTLAEISEGNLSLEIIEYGDEEIRQLLRSLEKLRVKLQESVKIRGQTDENRKTLVANISHDLKTPITSIRGYVAGILDGVADTPEKRQKYLKTIEAKAELLDKLINDLEFYSKLELNQVPYRFELTDPKAFIMECIEENRESYRQDQIEFSMENNLSGSFLVSIDRERMKRVLLNLFENARKYRREEKSDIMVVLRDVPDKAIIEVRDTGQGIPADSLPYIFDRFYRADNARSMANGSGLGLAIAREIVTDHKGAIWVSSKEHEGTTFTISLRKEKAEGS